MNDQRPERRRFQFGLRKLMLWTTAVALLLGMMAEVVCHAVDAADNRIETKSDGETRRD